MILKTSLMEEILDQDFNVNQPDETQINKTASIVRFCMCAIVLLNFCYILYFELVYAFSFYTLIRFSTLVSIWLIYHNFVIAREEWKSKYVVNITDIISTGFTLLIYITTIYRHANTIIGDIQHNIISYITIYDIVMIIGFVFIGSREIVYLIRDRRLKRLKNQ